MRISDWSSDVCSSDLALKIRSSKTARTFAAAQLATLDPGRYRLSWATARDDGKPDASITVAVRCEGSGELTDPYAIGNAAPSNRIATTFSVPARGCPVQTVVVQKAASRLGETQPGWIDDRSEEHTSELQSPMRI